MRVRLRPALTSAEMRMLYPRPHDHTRWKDHLIRVEETIEMGKQLLGGDVFTDTRPPIVADLSCGDAAIARVLTPTARNLILGDFAPGYEIQGPIERTIRDLHVPVDLFILSETLEHLEHPEAVLREIRDRSRMLLLSTPAWEADASNPEHIWSWSPEDVEEMLKAAGWSPALYRLLDLRPQGFVYAFQIWGCR